MNYHIHANTAVHKKEYALPGNNAPRWFLIMKLCIILLCAFCLHASAEAVAQRINLDVKNESLKNVLDDIQQQTEYSFVYNARYIQQAKPITIHIKGKDVLEALPLIFAGQPFDYSVRENVVSITAQPLLDKKTIPQQQTIRGQVTDSLGNPLVGVTVQVKESGWQTITDREGRYEIEGVYPTETLHFRLLSYETFETTANRPEINVTLRLLYSELQEVDVSLNTGYQSIPKERATGSFALVGNQLLNRRTGSNVLDRLEGIASGVMFPNKNIPFGSNESRITVRGRSTIHANAQPLIIVDNFPFQGDINTINPNDIENITVLKDAAAASIWGAFSGNGVIVINTKRGKLNNRLKIDYNGTFTVNDKPNLFYEKSFINSSEYIDLEEFLFNNGYYDSSLQNTTNRPLVSPAVEILAQERQGLITASQADTRLSELKQYDYRKDFEKYLYQNALLHQQAINISGGSNNVSYYFSGGFDDSRTSLYGNSTKRVSLNNYNTYMPVKNLELSVGLTYTQNLIKADNPGRFNPGNSKLNYYPYARLIDDNHTPLPMDKDYRLNYILSQNNDHLLDWTYNPLNEIENSDNNTVKHHIRINTGIKYKLLNNLSAEFRYQYEKSIDKQENFSSLETYFTRNIINRYTQINEYEIIRPIPIGGIMELTNTESTTNNLRGQLNYGNEFNRTYAIQALAGIEYRESNSGSVYDRLYGYDKKVLNGTNVNVIDRFPIYDNLSSNQPIPYFKSLSGLNDIWISYFGNASVSKNEKYILSGSIRIDQSNIFGANINRKSIPLWSSGIKWNISKEQFYHFSMLPLLSLRATYGFNGNIDRSTSAVLIGTYGTQNDLGLPTINLTSPPNAELRWEKTGQLNLGIDFVTENNMFSGSIEYYKKVGKDLIGQSPLPLYSGFANYRGNVANMKGSGVDIDLKGAISIHQDIHWFPNILFSINRERITSYDTELARITYAQSGPGYSSNLAPATGYPVYSIFSYRWEGLDKQGSPQGWADNEVSKDYLNILIGNGSSELIYHGPARPTIFGSFRNTFSYKKFDISANLTFKLGYYFRKSSIDYNVLLNNWGMHEDYSRRWRQTGDELMTDIPGFIYPVNSAREAFYTYSEATVRNGNHIRLQDLQVSYEFNKSVWLSKYFSRCQVYLYANNLGLIYRKNKEGIDPDYLSSCPDPKSLSIGLRLGVN